MDDTNPGLATGILLVLVGVWVVSRTLVHDAQGFNLVDRIIALTGGGGPNQGSRTSASPLQKLILPLSPSQGQGVPGIDFSGKPPKGYHVTRPGEKKDLVIAGPGGKPVPVTRGP